MTRIQSDMEEELRHARDLGEADNPLPREAKASYQGPNAFGMSIVRGGIFAAMGWFGGNLLGNLGSKHQYLTTGEVNPRYHSFKARNLGAALGFVGAVMGAYSGSKAARGHRRQVEELQDITQKMHRKIGDLQGELLEQVKARNGNGSPKINHIDPAWEKEREKDAAPKDKADEKPQAKPEATVAARSVQQEAVQAAEIQR